MSQDHETDRKASNTVLAIGVGMVAGALVGAALGLLLAPKSGAALRRDIARRARKVQDEASDHVERVGEIAGELADRGRDIAKRAQNAVEAGLHEVRRRTDAAIDAVDKAKA
jgi:gas vesicle protein